MIMMAASGSAMAQFSSGKLNSSLNLNNDGLTLQPATGATCSSNASNCRHYDFNGYDITRNVQSSNTNFPYALYIDNAGFDFELTNTQKTGGNIKYIQGGAVNSVGTAIDMAVSNNVEKVTLSNITVFSQNNYHGDFQGNINGIRFQSPIDLELNNVSLEVVIDNKGTNAQASAINAQYFNDWSASSNISLNNSKIVSGDILFSNLAGGNETFNVNFNNSTVGQKNGKIKIDSTTNTAKGEITTNLTSSKSNIFADILLNRGSGMNMDLGLSSYLAGDVHIAADAHSFNGTLTDGAIWKGRIINNQSAQPDTANVTLAKKSTWIVSGKSDADNVNVSDSTIDIREMKKSNLSIKNLNASNATLLTQGNDNDGIITLSQAKGDIRVVRSSKLESGISNKPLIVLEQNAQNALNVTGSTEAGLYQYDVVSGKAKDGSTHWSFANSGASNAGSVIQAMAGAPVSLANQMSDTLSTHQGAVRMNENNDGGVWLQYFGGKQKHTTAGKATYKLNTNGVMLGGDTLIDAGNGSWLAGLAASALKTNMTTKQSKGDIKGYSVHAYLTRQYDNGVFVDVAALLGRFNNTADVRLTNNSGEARAQFDTWGFGTMVKGGYTWKSNDGAFIEPYAKLSAFSLNGVDYKLKDLTVHSDHNNSVQGEIGTRTGYTFTMGNSTLTPYLNFAGLKEFSDGNKVSLENETVNASIRGAAFRVGAGVQADIADHVSTYASLDYTKGSSFQSPLQGVVGVNVIW